MFVQMALDVQYSISTLLLLLTVVCGCNMKTDNELPYHICIGSNLSATFITVVR